MNTKALQPPNLGDLNNRHLASGRVIFVAGGIGLDTNEGTDPDFPKKTYASALALCTDYQNDYIFIRDSWNEDGGQITVSKHGVHIIGIGRGANPIAWLAATGDIHMMNVTGYYVELAGLGFGGGGTKAGIQASNSTGLWVHDCFFGLNDIGDTPQEGILLANQVNAYMAIENNLFTGSQGDSQGKISASGIRGTGTNLARQLLIRGNRFLAIPTNAIRLENCYDGQILENFFRVPDAANGEAIYLGANARECVVLKNRAANGMLNAGYTYNPYRDTSPNTANGWGDNYRGNSVIEPVGA